MGNVFEEIDSLKQRIRTSYDVLQAAGGIVPSELSTQTTYNLSAAIERFSTPVQDDWRLPVGWPDLREVVKNDPFKNAANVAGRMAVLIKVGDNNLPMCRGDDRSSWGTWYPRGCGINYIGFRTSNDPSIFVSATNTTQAQVDWDHSKYIQGIGTEKYVWVEMYYKIARCTWSGGNGYPADYCPGLLWMCGDKTSAASVSLRFSRNCRALTDFEWCEAGAYVLEQNQLETIPPLSASPTLTSLVNLLDYTQIRRVNFLSSAYPLSCATLAALAAVCTSLEEFPDVLFEGNQVSNVNNIAATCPAITRYPDTLDYSKVSTNAASFWNYSNHIRQCVQKLPSKMIFPDALTLSCQFNQMGQIYPDTIARFDDQGHLSGGWFYGWTRNPGYTTDLSVKFQTTPVNWMTAAQKAEVSSYLQTKGFYVYGL